MSYNEAVEFCSNQSDSIFSPSIVQVKPWELSSFFNGFESVPCDNVWLAEQLNQYRCMRMEPRENNWQHVNCSQQNFPLCQMGLEWSLEDIMRKITDNGVNIATLGSRVTPIKDTLTKITVDHSSMMAQIDSRIPIGFIYIEYHNQVTPSELWPNMKWDDVTSEFGGHFFRALGGDSAAWGQKQNSCAPRISRIDNYGSNDYAHGIDLPTSGWSARLFTGKFEQLGTATGFHVEGCEVRPVNSAIRIWKRVA